MIRSYALLYEKYGRYYDVIYSSIDYRKEAEEVKDLLEKADQGISSIVDLGCGTGSYIEELTKLGYTVDGWDSSPQMVATARQKLVSRGVSSEIILKDIADFSSEKKYDAAICLFGVLDYLYDDSLVLKFLQGVYHGLNDGGLFLVDFMGTDGLSVIKPRASVLQGNQGDLKSFRATFSKADPERSRFELDFKCTIYRERDIVDYFEELHSLRLFDNRQLLSWFESAGFSPELNITRGLYTRILLRKVRDLENSGLNEFTSK